MKFDTYFRVTSYGLIASAFAALALTGELDALSVVLYSMALAACYYIDAKGVTKWRLKEWMWRTLTVLYIPFMLFDGVALSDKVLALVHLSLFASAAKLYQNKTDRDWVFLYLIAFFQMLLAAGLTFNATFVASLVVFLFFFISTLAAFEIRRARRGLAAVQEEIITPVKPTSAKSAKVTAKKSVAGEGVAPRRISRIRYLVIASLIQAVIIVVLTLPFFFMIPRFNSANVGSGFGETAPMTGFSDTVELGQVASIKENRRVVMRVKLDRQPKKYLRWRGKVLERYNGRAWSLEQVKDRVTDVFTIQTGSAPADGKPFIIKSALFEEASPSDVLTQQIALQPLNTSTLFATRTTTVVDGHFPRVGSDKFTGALSLSSLSGRVINYTVKSNIGVPSAAELRAADSTEYPPIIIELYTQKPRAAKDETPLDPRVRKLALEITAHAPSPYEKAKAVEEFLKTQFSYTLNLKMGGSDPLAEFLFDTREGHCEYFATAMVMLLRSIDIPARIVNGFQMGEYNQLNDLYTVRESDAHSWVEVYFPVRQIKNTTSEASSSAPKPDITGYWVEFDPTPSAGINDYSQGGIAAALRKYMDAMEVFWLDYVVTLDREEQASMMVEAQQRLVALKNAVLRYYKAAKLWIRSKINALLDAGNWTMAKTVRLLAALTVALLLAFAGYVALAYRKRRRLAPTGYNPWWYRLFVAPILRRLKRKGRDHQASAVLFYEQMLATAARAGLVKQPGQTPLEFAAAASFPQIREITRVYNRVRFGGAALDDGEAQKVSALLADLRQAVAGR